MMQIVTAKEQKVVKQGDVTAQSSELLDVIGGGGIAILPLDVAYAIVGNSEQAIRGIFTAKQRSYEKPSGMFSNYDLCKDVQIMEARQLEIVRAVIFDNDLPFSTVAPFSIRATVGTPSTTEAARASQVIPPAPRAAWRKKARL